MAAAASGAVERWLEAEREQLPLWLPVMLGAGVALWFILPDDHAWTAALLGLAAAGLAGTAVARSGRLARSIVIAVSLAALGLGLAWWRAERVAAPILAGTAVASFTARVERVEVLGARDLLRLTLRPGDGAKDGRGQALPLPPRIRVNVAVGDAPTSGLAAGATVAMRARLMPPPAAAIPGAYDFARVAWFAGIGGTGRGLRKVTLIQPASEPGGDLRRRLTRHITHRLPGSRGGIAAALVTGDEGNIEEADDQAMRRAGLAHLLSVSGLHITATVGAAMFVVLRLLALSPWLAMRVRLPLVAALAGAAAAIGYTLLTGSQVPTIRSCIAALLVLAALALGREAMTLRLVAAAAFVLIAIWPEALAGPSFQLSFGAVTAIMSLHGHPRIAAFFGPHEEGWVPRQVRALGSLLLTGLAVELALMPIAVFHFHQAGLYGAMANIVAIPLTTFVIMPLEALALLLDAIGIGGPVWWLTAQALTALLALAHGVSDMPGSVTALPAMRTDTFALMVAGGLWLFLWRTRVRYAGLVALVIGAAWALATPAPDLLVTGDGRHLAVRTTSGALALLRDRAGDYTRGMLATNGGLDGEPLLLSEQRDARCSADLCMTDLVRDGQRWRLLATRSAYSVEWSALVAACASADIVVSDRRLPRGCKPRWLKLDKATLTRSGGVALTLKTGRIVTVRNSDDQHPWIAPPLLPRPAMTRSRFPFNRSGAGYPTAYPGSEPDAGRSVADHRPGWPDRDGS
ncbi:ComEC/Rec2 family competence protein [Sphingomonas gellani]|nr:ComEC/Rec2 family competence protein [Sphingomonas gellani]